MFEDEQAERRQGQGEALRLSVLRDRRRPRLPAIAEPAAAIASGIAVQPLAPEPGSDDADAVIMARYRCHIGDDEHIGRIRAARTAEGEDAVGAVIGDDPGEAFGRMVEPVERRRVAIQPVQVADQP